MARIRPALPEDLPAIRSLLAGEGLPADDLEPHLAHFFVAEDHGRLLGVCGLESHPPFGLMRSLAVAEPWRGRGLGRSLGEAVATHARRTGLRELYLLTTRSAAVARRLGFHPVNREEAPPEIRGTTEFSHACPASARLMRRRL
ncbi:MAG: GNAT family N-acetyltransferase [Acidobacteria bacterium]|nr:MAG: GNAT family N-acetyltransferase [Acidobacteriota bacterium]